MIDKLVSALRPYDGTETSPFMFLRMGQIVKVYASASDCGTDKDPKRYVGTVEVEWLDRMAPKSELVPWTYSSFSNPTISKTESSTTETASGDTIQSATGSSCGVLFVPSDNDLVVCGYRGPMHPIILGFLPHNLNKQLEGTETSFGPFRTLQSGEYDIKSQQQSEIYLDRAGSIQLIVKQQTAGSGTPPIDTTVVPSTELARISLGVTYDSSFTNPVTSTYGQNVICDISLSNGSKVKIDNSGNVEIYASGQMSHKAADNFDLQSFSSLHGGADTSLGLGSGGNLGLGGDTVLVSGPNGITMNGSSITLNDGTKGAARLDDATLSNSTTDSTFWTWFNNLMTAINGWTPVPLDGGAALKTAISSYVASPPSSVTGKINAGSSTVNVG